jgi:hypothetical protein
MSIGDWPGSWPFRLRSTARLWFIRPSYMLANCPMVSNYEFSMRNYYEVGAMMRAAALTADARLAAMVASA